MLSGNNNDNWMFDFEHTSAKVYLQTVDNDAGDIDFIFLEQYSVERIQVLVIKLVLRVSGTLILLIQMV